MSKWTDSATRWMDMYRPNATLKPMLPVVACAHGTRPMSLMWEWASSSRLPGTAMLNFRGRLPRTGLPRVPMTGSRRTRSLRALQISRVSTLSRSSMPARGWPAMFRTLSRALWKDVWFRACRPSMMAGESSILIPRSWTCCYITPRSGPCGSTDAA